MLNINDIIQNKAAITGLNFNEATDLRNIETISRLANEIWREHYIPIIGLEQVEYMLARFQSTDAICSQIDAGFRYFLLEADAEPAAYFALLPDIERRSLHISKLYVRANRQRAGLGNHIVAFIEAYGRRLDSTELWLTVNRHNRGAIDFYLRNKFTNVGTSIQDIGGGYVMDDFKMVKCIG